MSHRDEDDDGYPQSEDQRDNLSEIVVSSFEELPQDILQIIHHII